MNSGKQNDRNTGRDVCFSGKIGYDSKDRAKRAMVRLSDALRCYQCKDCGKWHLSGKRREGEHGRDDW